MLISGLCIGQVQCIFSLPPHAMNLWFLAQSGAFPHKHFTYIEWFTQAQKDQNSKLFKVSHLMAQGERCVSIIPVSLILSSIQLFLKFGAQAPVSWSSSNVFESATSFYVYVFSLDFCTRIFLK